MPVVIPFQECLARPSDDGPSPTLVEHLEAVAHRCGSISGDTSEKLAFLAGLLHDVGKCQSSWQEYVRGEKGKGPPHAPVGAVLFWYFAEQLLDTWGQNLRERRTLTDLSVDWVRTIYAHHTDFPDLDDRPPWEKYFTAAEIEAQLRACDLEGIGRLVRKWFPQADSALSSIGDWLKQCGDRWEWHKRFGRPRLVRGASGNAGPEADERWAFALPQMATRLVVADRYHAAGFEASTLETRDASQALHSLTKYCQSRSAQALRAGANQELVEQR